MVGELSCVAYHDYLNFLYGWVNPEEGPDDECTRLSRPVHLLSNKIIILPALFIRIDDKRYGSGLNDSRPLPVHAIF